MGALIIGLIALGLISLPSDGKHLTIQLSRGPLIVYEFPSSKQGTKALLLFASGDGGWSSLESPSVVLFRSRGMRLSESIPWHMPRPTTAWIRCKRISVP